MIKSTKTVHIQASMFVCAKSSIEQSICHWGKIAYVYQWLSLLINIKLCYKKERVNMVVVCMLVALTCLKKLVNREMLYQWMGLLTNVILNHVINKMTSEVGCFFGDHECTYSCISLLFVWKWNENRFINTHV